MFTWSSAECLEVHELKWEVRVGRVVPLNSTGPVFGPCLIPHRSRADRFHSSLCVNFHILSTLSIFPDLSTNHRRASICCSQELVFFFIISGWQEYFSYLYFSIPEVKKVLSELSSRRSAALDQNLTRLQVSGSAPALSTLQSLKVNSAATQQQESFLLHKYARFLVCVMFSDDEQFFPQSHNALHTGNKSSWKVLRQQT